MSKSPPSLMDGVPVKISESFKPPPKISLPQSVTNRLVQFENGANSVRYSHTYDFTLEETVLKRITEWRAVKEKDRYERQERLRLKEQERIRFIEEEQKRKLNQISYPNTDDLSSASEEDEQSEENDDSNPSGSSEEHVQSTVAGQHSQMNFDSILIPTVLPDTSVKNTNDKMIDLSSLISYNIPKKTNLFNNNNNNSSSGYNKINYSDFENDTSSPFDNMELKTINDLDILAQVLNLNVSNSCSEMKTEEASKNETESMDLEVHVPERKPRAAEQPQLNYDQQAQYQHAAYPTPVTQQPTSTSNDYYSAFNSYHYNYGQYVPVSAVPSVCYAPATANPALLNQYQTLSNTSYQSGSQTQYQPYSQSSRSPATYTYYPYTSSLASSVSQSTYAPSYSSYHNSYGQQVSSTGSYRYSVQAKAGTMVQDAPSAYGTSNIASELSTTDASTLSTAMNRSKSKSVPDIVRQLDEEVKDSAQRRTRNNSQSIVDEQDNGRKVQNTAASTEQDFTIYNQLSLADQNLVKSIGSMGFPLERVAAVLKRIGSDDKKIVEHLIPLSELLDLGFEEEKISEALLKFGNNKHKALDYLIL
ncbi:putative mediator of RNA polymerase II transcription subunit 26 [Sabethes cyaneus]|uniref:putative mediator of RNA polymerase II transcription subunit 26 n=1 Tax=Sabethes cyaneus TaxID=53552 RepID=UPI00237D3DA9|nr:putative mediator of RNA polymerase II transcription subunit 26 [Sabethes cyaneus]